MGLLKGTAEPRSFAGDNSSVKILAEQNQSGRVIRTFITLLCKLRVLIKSLHLDVYSGTTTLDEWANVLTKSILGFVSVPFVFCTTL